MGLSMLDTALSYRGKGWSLLPLYEGRRLASGRVICRCNAGPECQTPLKHPKNSHGVVEATNDAETIERWWGQWWPHAGIGVATGTRSNLVVVDIDPRAEGWEDTFEQAKPYLDGTATVVATGGGGWHHYYVCTESFASFRLGPGIDVQGDGKYVVAPPSPHASGLFYAFTRNGTIDPLPDWWREHSPALAEPDDQSRFEMPMHVPAGERNDTLFRYASSLRARGARFEDIRFALDGANARCSPSLTPRELETIAHSVVKYPEPPAIEISETSVIEIVGEARRQTMPTRFSLAELAEMDIPEPKWLLPGVFAEGVNVLAGKEKLGKSWLALTSAMEMSLEYPVIYFALEDNAARLKWRTALLQEQGVQGDRLGFCTEIDGMQALVKEIVAQQATLVIIDTLARIKPLASNRDQNNSYERDYAFMGQFNQVFQATGCSFVLVTHMTKAKSEGLDAVTGSKGITGAADAIQMMTKKDPETIHLSVESRDHEAREWALIGTWPARRREKWTELDITMEDKAKPTG